MDWFRWHNGTVTDPKWRVIAKRAGVPLHMVIAVWPALLEAANQAAERGTLESFDPEDVAAALDLDPGQVFAIVEAMQGKVLDGVTLTGWEKRNPKREREDSSTDRVRRYRERKAMKHHETPGNAEKPLEERRREESTTPPGSPSDEGELHGTGDPKADGDPPAEPPQTRRKRRSPALPLPENWEPSDAHAEKADTLGVDLEAEVEKFRNHAAANDRRQRDWSAAFHNWLLTAAEYASSRGSGGGGAASHLSVIAGGQAGPPNASDVLRRQQEADAKREQETAAWRAAVGDRFAKLPKTEREQWKDQVRALPELKALEAFPEPHERLLRQRVYELFGETIGLPYRRSA